MPSDVAYLRTRLRCEPETGRLYWLPCSDRPDWWNTRYANTEAFTAIGAGGYRVGRLDGKRLYAHRVVWALVHGEWPADKIDHEDRDKTDNRPGRLTVAGDRGNMRNRGITRSNTSSVVGVYWNKAVGKWHARITVDYEVVHLGYFDDLGEASAVRRAAEREYGFHPNHGVEGLEYV